MWHTSPNPSYTPTSGIYLHIWHITSHLAYIPTSRIYPHNRHTPPHLSYTTTSGIRPHMLHTHPHPAYTPTSGIHPHIRHTSPMKRNSHTCFSMDEPKVIKPNKIIQEFTSGVLKWGVKAFTKKRFLKTEFVIHVCLF